MEMFREKGFKQTTMLDIAAKAGVALGGAYYYFSPKKAIVLAFYQEMQEGSHEGILQAISGEKKLKDRLRCVMEKALNCWCPTGISATRFPPFAGQKRSAVTFQ
jgi:AcrR family transcriptional regulator